MCQMVIHANGEKMQDRDQKPGSGGGEGCTLNGIFIANLSVKINENLKKMRN